jgi:hypothetical protein
MASLRHASAVLPLLSSPSLSLLFRLDYARHSPHHTLLFLFLSFPSLSKREMVEACSLPDTMGTLGKFRKLVRLTGLALAPVHKRG